MPRSSTIRFNLLLLILLAIVMSYGSCNWRGLFERAESLVEKLVKPKTAREKYLSRLEKEGAVAGAVLEKWEQSFTNADTQQLVVTLPHREIFALDGPVATSAQAIRFTLPGGRILRVTGEVDSGKVFGELYRVMDDGRRSNSPVRSWEEGKLSFDYEPAGRSERMIFLLQSAPGTRVDAQIALTTKAALLFPVAGKDQRAIKSFWGDSRAGGKRAHKGNDIFAPKGTPLLAVADGRIRKVANGGLGGKTIWLYDRKRNQSYYYAHLDSQYVRRAQNVRRGDTLGTVGNTGNARTTPPHLHFGVYAGGAYDPNPLLRNDDPAPPQPKYRLNTGQATLAVPKRGNHYLRQQPDRKGTVLRQLENEEPVTGISVTGRFYRVLTERGEYGYVNFD
ncbi:peptidoglycan DD-metalloendopeptidase family protein [Neolewinella antarctica]|uniref:Murein DD-endopeptidase MepM/ murein hydrolase activator NlpD n=1 Tax=Neolewinella antarctica TaxID=442734 RepID=A0ABX0XCQ1_9BACT|nr:M23 family metallopeptidase [Neolewinella antarctica]NJC26613.1 murein DD-endopeptidase MepM/ murein hydrolase activator NlpD [Neolewinella antarctica]